MSFEQSRLTPPDVKEARRISKQARNLARIRRDGEATFGPAGAPYECPRLLRHQDDDMPKT